MRGAFTKSYRARLGLAAMLFIASAVAFPAWALAAQEASRGAALKNLDVVRMVQAGLGDDLIIAKIKSSPVEFDTSIDALLELKTAGVSEGVIQAMVEASARQTETAAAVVEEVEHDPNDPRAPHDAGIYWLRQDGEEQELVQLEPSVYSQGKSGGMFASAMTYGIHKAKWKAVVRSPAAVLRITDSNPEFWFYFEQTAHGLSYSGTFIGGASSPNEFLLAKMDRKKNERELVVAQMGAYSYSLGTRPEDTVPLEFEKVAPGIYRVWPGRALPPGEYCFFYAGTSMGMGMTGGKLFDFGVDPAR